MPDDAYRKIAEALSRQRAAERVNFDFATRQSIAGLTIHDLSEALADTAKGVERRLVQHTVRAASLVEMKSRHDLEHERVRIDKLVHRIFQLESAVRRLEKGKR